MIDVTKAIKKLAFMCNAFGQERTVEVYRRLLSEGSLEDEIW